jgi:hypothetical protein
MSFPELEKGGGSMKKYSRRRVSALLFAALVFWLFPHAADAQTQELIETGRYGTGESDLSPDEPERVGYTNRWLYLGVRAGPSMRFYIPLRDIHYTGNDTQVFSFDTAIQANLQILSYLSIQGEALFTQDNASRKHFSRNAAGQIEEHTLNYTSFSLQFPLSLRLNFYPGKFRISPFFGVYYIAALGKLRIENSLDDQEKSLDYGVFPPFGLLGGLNAALQWGPGMIFADLRYSDDLGEPTTWSEKQETYKRSMISFTVGYEFGLFTKKSGGQP